MASPAGPAHRRVSSIRPGISSQSANTTSPGSPHTPLRTISSAFGSPSALRAEEDCVIIELGSRYLRAGFAGDAVPKAVVDFSPEKQRRPGDYRQWEADYDQDWRKRVRGAGWGESHELWKFDLRGVDLGLVGDKIERAMREALTKYLLIDSRPRRMVLALPSTLPLPLLSTILDGLFTNFQPPTISLMSAPVLTTVAAGLRSALIVDIGWAETVVTALYEYREVHCCRSVRATKLLGQEMYQMLIGAVDPTTLEKKSSQEEDKEVIQDIISFEECEEVIARMAWCKPAKTIEQKTAPLGLTPVKEEDELISSMRSLDTSGDADVDPIRSVPLTSTNPPITVHIPFSKFAEPCEIALFAAGTSIQDLDDEELPLPILVYRSLLQLPVDIRATCMSRIIFVGGGSNLLGLKARILDEVSTLIQERGWDPVRGRAVEQFRINPKLRQNRSKQASNGPTEILQDSDGSIVPKISSAAALANQEPDPIEDQLRREATRDIPLVEQGFVRAVESLGAWSGASLLSQLKIPAVSVVEREQWLQHGASGASKPGETTIGNQRQSMGPVAFKTGAGERSSWTLGLWG